VTTCNVTVYDAIPPRLNARGRGATCIIDRPCGAAVVAHGLCAKHLADRVRLGGAA
jgi:hypothetical protein